MGEVKVYLVVGIVLIGVGIVWLTIRKRKGYTTIYTKYAPAYSSSENNNPVLGAPIPNSYSQRPIITNPILEYQRRSGSGMDPVTFRDPIRGPTNSGPIYIDEDLDSQLGPYPGKPMGVPVPMGTLKETNERYSGRNELARWLNNMWRWLGPRSTPFYGSVYINAPFPSINSFTARGTIEGWGSPVGWEKAGILTSRGTTDIILNLYRRPIAPAQDVWEYQVEDADGFIIKLTDTYLEDGDIVKHVIGKSTLGPWVVHMFAQNKWVWV